jgi:hypothetical protein
VMVGQLRRAPIHAPPKWAGCQNTLAHIKKQKSPITY